MLNLLVNKHNFATKKTNVPTNYEYFGITHREKVYAK